MKKLSIVIAVMLLLISSVMPTLAQDENIVEVADGAGNFTTLLAAAQAAGLAETLATGGPFTVFAPTDDAFAALLAELGVSAEDLLADTDLLTSVLLYHVVDGAVFSETVVTLDGEEVMTLNGAPITVSVTDDGVVLNDSINVTAVDIAASNGVIHVIDGVLLPPADDMMEDEMMEEEVDMTHVRVAHFSPDTPAVDVYVNGEVAIEGLEFPSITDYLTIPAGEYEIAVAPGGTSIDEAAIGPATLSFEAHAWTTVAAIGSLEAGTLAPAIISDDTSDPGEGNARVVVYHAIEGAPAVDVWANGSVVIPALAYPGTMDGNDGLYELVVPAGSYDLAVSVSGDAEAIILSADGVEFEAGITYFIAAVGTPDEPQIALASVNPEEMMMEDDMAEEVDDDMMAEMGNIVEVADAAGNFTTLLAAAQAAGLADTLATGGPFTVFAPTDDAFAALLESLGVSAEDLLADTELLTSVLLYHVVDSAVYSDTVMALDGEEVETLNGASITVSVTDDGVVLNDSINVIAVDVEASNGVIHVIDGVLLPPA